MYQYHVMRFSGILTEIVRSWFTITLAFPDQISQYSRQLDNIITLETECSKTRLWWPSEPFRRVLQWNLWSHAEDMDQEDDEDPGTFHARYTRRV